MNLSAEGNRSQSGFKGLSSIPRECSKRAKDPGGISVESIFTLEQYAFRAALNEAIHNAALKAEELGDAVQKT